MNLFEAIGSKVSIIIVGTFNLIPLGIGPFSRWAEHNLLIWTAQDTCEKFYFFSLDVYTYIFFPGKDVGYRSLNGH